MSTQVQMITLAGKEYVVLPRNDYIRITRRTKKRADDTVDALTFMREAVAWDLRVARETAGLTQGELADKLGKSQTMISRAETGELQVGERYITSLLKACGLSKNWKAAPKR